MMAIKKLPKLSPAVSMPVTEVPPRKTVQVTFSDGRVFEGPRGAKVETFIKAAFPNNDPPVITCMVNNLMRELSYHADTDLFVTPITLAESDGMRIYRRSLSLLLVAAAEKLFPGIRIIIEYGLNFGGLYFEITNHPPLSPTDIDKLRSHMRALVEADLPIAKERVSLAEAEAYFEEKGWDDKLRLLQTRRKDYLTLYTINQTKDYLHGYMVPSTGYLKYFDVNVYDSGYVLQYPRSSKPNVIRKPADYPKLVAVFNEYSDWMKALDIPDVGQLNSVIQQDKTRELVLVSEALHEQRIAKIAAMIAQERERIKLVSIAGPSSSGKTTFSKRLAIQLRTYGIKLMTIGLDDFFVNRLDTPLDEDGDYDYESLYSLDLKLFNSVLLGLINKTEVMIPRYNFMTGQRENGETITVKDDFIFIVEGIHGLNPELFAQIPPEQIFRIYVSALTQLNIDDHNRVPTTDNRLLRRIVRDASHRGYTATDTILRWPKVRRGEHKWIFPYQENADAFFNSALMYELAVLKPQAEPLLQQVSFGKPAHREAKRLLSFLQWFNILPNNDLIPDNSILREFIGGSILRDYTP